MNGSPIGGEMKLTEKSRELQDRGNISLFMTYEQLAESWKKIGKHKSEDI